MRSLQENLREVESTLRRRFPMRDVAVKAYDYSQAMGAAWVRVNGSRNGVVAMGANFQQSLADRVSGVLLRDAYPKGWAA